MQYGVKEYCTMQKAAQDDEKEIIVKMGRFNEPTQEVSVSEETTIQEVLDELGYSVNPSETLWVGGVKAELSDIVEDGDYISVTGKKEGGSDDEPTSDESTPEVDASDSSDDVAPSEEPVASEPEEAEDTKEA